MRLEGRGDGNNTYLYKYMHFMDGALVTDCLGSSCLIKDGVLMVGSLIDYILRTTGNSLPPAIKRHLNRALICANQIFVTLTTTTNNTPIFTLLIPPPLRTAFTNSSRHSRHHRSSPPIPPLPPPLPRHVHVLRRRTRLHRHRQCPANKRTQAFPPPRKQSHSNDTINPLPRPAPHTGLPRRLQHRRPGSACVCPKTRSGAVDVFSD